MSRTPLILTGGLLAVVGGIVAAGIAVSCSGPSGKGDAPRAAPTASRDLVLVVSGDTQGWLVPCGCASNQSGGLLRRGTYVTKLRESADVVYLDAGGAPGGASLYELARFEAILKGELALDLAAHNIGGPEAALGPEALRRLAAELHVPFISANAATTSGERLAPTHRIVTTGRRTLLVVGVLSQQFATPDVRVTDPRDAVLEVLEEVQTPFETLVVLAYLPEAELRSFARELPEADLVVGGPTGQSIPPERAGPALLAAATNKGKFLVEFTAVEGAEHDWSGRTIEVTAELADDPQQVDNLRAFRAFLVDRDYPAAESGFAPDLPANIPRSYAVAGSQSCRDCHTEDCRVWDDSTHSHAWQTLMAEGAHVDSWCQQCHTTGFGLPGGFVSARRSTDRINVGCESCHGPSRAHVDDPQVRTPFAAQDRCVVCHDRENSPEFNYGVYWPQIQHGDHDANAP